MRYLILSDIHANVEALEAVLESSKSESVEQVLVLGDLVGYGGGPNEVVDRVRSIANRVIRGNHDKVVAQFDGGENFNAVALAAARWTADALSEKNMEYLRNLDKGPVEIERGVILCHGSPLDEDEYVMSLETAQGVFEQSSERLAFFGH
ncbi:MAG: metallophosphoesterase, partial [Acidobacteriota bacterium]|nr:metallophosphoesterase [Acidobacteriota bacterium]